SGSGRLDRCDEHILCILRLGGDRRNHFRGDDFDPPRLAASQKSVRDDPGRDGYERQSQRAIGDCRETQKVPACFALWDSYCDWHHYLLPMGRAASMSTQTNFFRGMLSRSGFGGNIPPSGQKLEKLCRTCRRNRRGAAAVEFAVVSPVLFLLIFGMIEYGR